PGDEAVLVDRVDGRGVRAPGARGAAHVPQPHDQRRRRLRGGARLPPGRRLERMEAAARPRRHGPRLVVRDPRPDDVAAGAAHGPHRHCLGPGASLQAERGGARPAQGGRGATGLRDGTARQLGDVPGVADAGRPVRGYVAGGGAPGTSPAAPLGTCSTWPTTRRLPARHLLLPTSSATSSPTTCGTGGTSASSRASPPSRTATCTSATPRASA